MANLNDLSRKGLLDLAKDYDKDNNNALSDYLMQKEDNNYKTIKPITFIEELSEELSDDIMNTIDFSLSCEDLDLSELSRMQLKNNINNLCNTQLDATIEYQAELNAAWGLGDLDQYNIVNKEEF